MHEAYVLHVRYEILIPVRVFRLRIELGLVVWSMHASRPRRNLKFQSSLFLLLNGADEVFDVHLVGRDLPRPAELPPPQRELWKDNQIQLQNFHGIITQSRTNLIWRRYIQTLNMKSSLKEMKLH